MTNKRLKKLNSKKIAYIVHLSDTTYLTNTITTHGIYKVQVYGTISLFLKAKVVSHSRKIGIWNEIKTDFANWLPPDNKVVASIATLCQWELSKIDVEAAALQTGEAGQKFMQIHQ